MTKTAETLIALLRGAITETHDPIDLAGLDRDVLFSLAKLHDVAPIACEELMRQHALSEDEASRMFKKQHKLAMFRHLQRTVAIGQIRGALEAAEVPFVLLKGAYLMELYPQAWMRTCTDVDVLVAKERYDAAAEALRAAGFQKYATTPHDASFHSPEQYPVELHFQLVEDDRLPGVSRVLSRVWDYTDPANPTDPTDPPRPASCERTLRDEVFYLYHLAHMAKHFQSGGGCGIRSFLDLWLLNHTVPFDKAKRDALIRESGIAAFARAPESLTEKWFSAPPSSETPNASESSETSETPDLSELEDYVLHGGLYGTLKRAAMVRKSKTGNPVRYYARRLFLPYRTMRDAYPTLRKHPTLLPVYWVVRWGKLLGPTGRKRATREIRVTHTMDPAERTRIETLMKQLELW